ncbi:MAG: HEPN domain-containing protein [Nanoarchaeota archaeon]
MIPKGKDALEKEYSRCLNKKTFVKISNASYIDYLDEAYFDLNSAEKDTDEKWAITKAYQALFLTCNALLVRKLGYYSKDHSCVIISLMRNNIISENTLEKIKDMLNEKRKLFSELQSKNNLFDEISNIRITRNKYLYLPKTQRRLKSSVKGIIEEVKELIKILGDIE